MKPALALALASALALGLGTAEALEAPKPPAKRWSYDGMFGTFDRASLRRGLQVYREVCAACHSLKLVAYRHLEGVGFSDAEVKAIAASVEVQDGPNDQGEMFQRPGKPFDTFKSPFANEQAARAANNGALPPDLSVITKARKGGSDYLYAVLAGYQEAPAGFALMEGMSYNKYFPGQQIAMPPPLADGQVTFADGTQATVDQMARDVTTFLAWAGEPELEERKRLGVKVLLFVIVLTAMLYAVKRQIWASVH
jgi:ubiquinol-cytochrome c reductase cytochrome c1 subunit